MALFKSLRGKRENLPSTKTDGYAYFCTDDGTFWIDYKDENNIIQRKQLNAKDAETLMGASLSTILNSSDAEIPTSKAISDAIPTKTSELTNDSGFLTSHQDISGKLDTTGDGSNVTAIFTAATSRANISTGEKLSVLFGKIAKWFADLGSLAFKSTVSKSDLDSEVQTSLGKADTALQAYTETDPTVPAWAKADTKPTYTASEVGALSSSAEVVKYISQSLTDTQKTQARTNIGAGTSSFSGSYNDLTNKPTIPSAYTLPVATDSDLGGIKSGGDITIASDGTVTVTKESLPTYSTADNGKVLMIVNGVPTWVTLNLTMDSDGCIKI